MPENKGISREEIYEELKLSNIFTTEDKNILVKSWGLMNESDKLELRKILKHEKEEYHKLHESMQEKIHEIFVNFVAQMKSIHWKVSKEITVISETKNQKNEEKVLLEIESEIDNL